MMNLVICWSSYTFEIDYILLDLHSKGTLLYGQVLFFLEKKVFSDCYVFAPTLAPSGRVRLG
jgi:hypothetical protein